MYEYYCKIVNIIWCMFLLQKTNLFYISNVCNVCNYNKWSPTNFPAEILWILDSWMLFSHMLIKYVYLRSVIFTFHWLNFYCDLFSRHCCPDVALWHSPTAALKAKGHHICLGIYDNNKCDMGSLWSLMLNCMTFFHTSDTLLLFTSNITSKKRKKNR